MNNPEELQHFLDILLKESNFTKAAQELYISQPYLTQLIKRIEKALGVKIIERDKPPYTLTPAGLVYYHYLESVAYDKHQLQRNLASYIHPGKQIIRIGILESLGTYLLPEILPAFLKTNPEVKIQLVEALPRESEKRLLNGDIDCYLGQTPEAIDSSLDVVVSGGEKYYVVISPASPYYQEGKFILQPDELKLKEVLQEPLVLSAPGSAIRHQVDGLFQRLKLQANIVMESKSVITATNLAVHGIGLTISSASIIKRIAQTPINLLPLDDNIINLTFFLATRRQEKLSSALKNLIKIFKNKDLKPQIN